MDDFDPFENDIDQIFNSFLGRPSRKRRFKEEVEEIQEFSEDDGYVYFTLELPGYNEKDIQVSVKSRVLEIRANKKSISKVKEYLLNKFQEGIAIQKSIPENANPKNFSYTFKNGILEVRFIKHD